MQRTLFADQQKVPPAARLLAFAIVYLGNPSRGCSEAEIVSACARMKASGVHEFDLGSSTNLRNRIQRNWAGAKIWRTTWRQQGYAAIFERVEGSHPTRWRVTEWFADQLRAELAGKV